MEAPNDRLEEFFQAWRRDVDSEPMPELIDLGTALHVLGLAKRAGAPPTGAPARSRSWERWGERRV